MLVYQRVNPIDRGSYTHCMGCRDQHQGTALHEASRPTQTALGTRLSKRQWTYHEEFFDRNVLYTAYIYVYIYISWDIINTMGIFMGVNQQ